jgi:flagellar hook-associated protein 1 FlgK
VQAIRDALVSARVQSETSAQSGADTISTESSNIQSLFNYTNDSGLMKQLTDFFNSFQTLAQDPASIPNRQQSNLKAHQALLTHLQNVKQSVSGVSIDEETVSILQFQRSYQTSARLIQTVDQLLQTALAMGASTRGA